MPAEMINGKKKPSQNLNPGPTKLPVREASGQTGKKKGGSLPRKTSLKGGKKKREARWPGGRSRGYR